jgi:hypothetical protein
MAAHIQQLNFKNPAEREPAEIRLFPFLAGRVRGGGSILISLGARSIRRLS